MLRKLIKKILHPFLKFGLSSYYNKPRKYSYDNIEVLVYPEVFPPHLTISTKILLDYIKPIDLQNKSFLELGCGSGIISLYASAKGAHVTATDINEIALNALQVAAETNQQKVTVLKSDLFESLQGKQFDYIFINPPYYPKNAKNVKEQAWYCGADFDYFKNLFQQLPCFLNKNVTFMILSQDCNIKKIKEIASKNGLELVCVLEKKVLAESNYIYKISRIKN